MKDKKTRILYISYNGLLEEIVPSQVIAYLKKLTAANYEFTLLTFERNDKVKEAGRQKMLGFKDDLGKKRIDWYWLRYHKRFPLFATTFDIAAGAICVIYFIIAKKIKMVHARSIVPAAMCLAAKLFGVKFIFDTRGLLAEEYVGGGHWKEGCFKYKLVKFFEKLCLKAADAVVVLTDKHRDYLLSLAWFAGKNKGNFLKVIPCCVDLDRFKSALNSSEEKLNNGFIFVYLGKVGKHYMMDEMLDFLKIAFKAMPSSKFMIITQSSQGPIWDMIDSKKLPRENILIKKPVFEEIPSLVSLAGCGIFFINPYKKFGSSPIKLGEFLSCGIPVIINRGIGDTEELVNKNKIGVVVDQFNEDSYKKALTELLELIRENKKLNDRCRCVASDYLSLELGVSRYKALYEDLLRCTA